MKMCVLITMDSDLELVLEQIDAITDKIADGTYKVIVDALMRINDKLRTPAPTSSPPTRRCRGLIERMMDSTNAT